MSKIAMTADLHFRSTIPEARMDDYLENQDNLLKWLKSFENDGYRFLCSGDVVHFARERANPLGWVNYLYNHLPTMDGCLGNHDLLYHRIDNLPDTTMGMLIDSGRYSIENIMEKDYEVHFFHYGQRIQHTKPKSSKTLIAVYHAMVTQEPNPFFEGEIAEDLLTEFPEYDIILTGDNHEGFVVAKDERVLINPGSLKRDTAAQIDHKPHIYLYDTETQELTATPVPIENDIISVDHIEKVKERDDRLEKLSDKFEEVRDVTLDYHENIMKAIEANSSRDDVELRILRWLE